MKNPTAAKQAQPEKAPQEAKKGHFRKSLSIDEAKLGITMVISKAEARILGFTGKEPTSEAIREIRERLGLASMGVRI